MIYGRHHYLVNRHIISVSQGSMTYHRFSNKRNSTGTTRGKGIAYPSGVPEFAPGFIGIHLAQSLVFYVAFYREMFVFLSFLFQPLYCLSFFDLRILITPLVSSNFSYYITSNKYKIVIISFSILLLLFNIDTSYHW